MKQIINTIKQEDDDSFELTPIDNFSRKTVRGVLTIRGDLKTLTQETKMEDIVSYTNEHPKVKKIVFDSVSDLDNQNLRILGQQNKNPNLIIEFLNNCKMSMKALQVFAAENNSTCVVFNNIQVYFRTPAADESAHIGNEAATVFVANNKSSTSVKFLAGYIHNCDFLYGGFRAMNIFK